MPSWLCPGAFAGGLLWPLPEVQAWGVGENRGGSLSPRP